MTVHLRFTALLIALLALLPGCRGEERISLKERPAEEYALIGGSESVIPILELLVESFHDSHPVQRFSFGPPGHTGTGIRGVHEGAYSIGALSRELRHGEEGLGLEEVWFAQDALVFVTHPSVTVANLSTESLRSLYTGDIRNWKEVGALTLPSKSSTGPTPPRPRPSCARRESSPRA